MSLDLSTLTHLRILFRCRCCCLGLLSLASSITIRLCMPRIHAIHSSRIIPDIPIRILHPCRCAVGPPLLDRRRVLVVDEALYHALFIGAAFVDQGLGD